MEVRVVAGKDRYDWSKIDPYLKEHYLTEKATDIAKKFNTKPFQIRDRANKVLHLCKQPKHKWTVDEKAYVLDNYEELGAVPIANTLNLSVSSVQKMAQELGVQYVPKDEYICSQGYKMIGKSKNRKAEHRRVMEEYLGRELSPNEIVHHIDGNKLNNDISNLVLTTRADHLKTHREDLEQGKRDKKASTMNDIV